MHLTIKYNYLYFFDTQAYIILIKSDPYNDFKNSENVSHQ